MAAPPQRPLPRERRDSGATPGPPRRCCRSPAARFRCPGTGVCRACHYASGTLSGASAWCGRQRSLRLTARALAAVCGPVRWHAQEPKDAQRGRVGREQGQLFRVGRLAAPGSLAGQWRLRWAVCRSPRNRLAPAGVKRGSGDPERVHSLSNAAPRAVVTRAPEGGPRTMTAHQTASRPARTQALRKVGIMRRQVTNMFSRCQPQRGKMPARHSERMSRSARCGAAHPAPGIRDRISVPASGLGHHRLDQMCRNTVFTAILYE
jgi:hypothetical protein